MSSKNKRGIFLGIWGGATLVLLLFPAPWEWGVFGNIMSAIHDKAGFIVQPAVHFFLMFIFTVLLTGLVPGVSPVSRALHAMGIAVVIAAGMELLQSFLPEQFSRECDPLDLIPSFAGIVCGSVLCLALQLRSSKS